MNLALDHTDKGVGTSLRQRTSLAPLDELAECVLAPNSVEFN